MSVFARVKTPPYPGVYTPAVRAFEASHSLPRWVSAKSSISLLCCCRFFFFTTFSSIKPTPRYLSSIVCACVCLIVFVFSCLFSPPIVFFILPSPILRVRAAGGPSFGRGRNWADGMVKNGETNQTEPVSSALPHQHLLSIKLYGFFPTLWSLCTCTVVLFRKKKTFGLVRETIPAVLRGNLASSIQNLMWEVERPNQ